MIFSDLHKKTWGYCWHLLRAKSCAYEAKKTSWAAFRGTLPAGWSRWSFLSPQHWWGHTWGSVSSSALFTERDTQTYQKESSKWPQISLKDWSHHPLRKGWESWDCSAWWREAWGGLSNVYKNVRKGYKDRDRLLSVVLSNRIRGNGYRTELWEEPYEHQETPSFSFLGDIKKWSQHTLKQPAPGSPAWKEMLDQMTTRDPFWLQPFSHSVILFIKVAYDDAPIWK